MDNIAGVILAGGKSSRMGRDKALLPFRGARLIDHVGLALRGAGLKDIFVSGEYEGFDCIGDVCHGAGPACGICSAVNALYGRFDCAVFVPVDLPYLEPHAIEVLLQSAHENGAHFDGQPLPLLIKFTSKNKSIFENALSRVRSEEKISVWQIIADTQCISLPPNAKISKQITGANTSADWEKVCTNE